MQGRVRCEKFDGLLCLQEQLGLLNPIVGQHARLARELVEKADGVLQVAELKLAFGRVQNVVRAHVGDFHRCVAVGDCRVHSLSLQEKNRLDVRQNVRSESAAGIAKKSDAATRLLHLGKALAQGGVALDTVGQRLLRNRANDSGDERVVGR